MNKPKEDFNSSFTFHEGKKDTVASGGAGQTGQREQPGVNIGTGRTVNPIGFLASLGQPLIKNNVSIELILKMLLDYRKESLNVNPAFSVIDFIGLADTNQVDVSAILMTYDLPDNGGVYVVPFLINETAKPKAIKTPNMGFNQQGMHPSASEIQTPPTAYYDVKYIDVIRATVVRNRNKNVVGIVPPVIIHDSNLTSAMATHYINQGLLALTAKMDLDAGRLLDSRAVIKCPGENGGLDYLLTLAQLIRNNNNTFLTCELNFGPCTEYTGANEPIAVDITATIKYNMNRNNYNTMGNGQDGFNSGADTMVLGRAAVVCDFSQINDMRSLPFNGEAPGFQPILAITSLDTAPIGVYSEMLSRIFGLTGVALMLTDDNWAYRYDPSVCFSKGPALGVLAKLYTPNRNVPLGEAVVVSNFDQSAIGQNNGTITIGSFLQRFCVSTNTHPSTTIPLVAIDLPYGSSAPLDEILFLCHPGTVEFEALVNTIDGALSVIDPVTKEIRSHFRKNLTNPATGQLQPLFLSNQSVPCVGNSCGTPYENIRLHALAPKDDGTLIDLRTFNLLDFINLDNPAALATYTAYTAFGYTHGNFNQAVIAEMKAVYKSLFSHVKFSGLGRRRYINPAFLNALTQTYIDIGLGIKPEGVQMPNRQIYTMMQMAPTDIFKQGGLFTNTGPTQINSSLWQGNYGAFTHN